MVEEKIEMEIEGYIERHGDRGIESKTTLKEKNNSNSNGKYFKIE